MRVVLAGGGPAGHIEPALALADALREADSSIQVTCLGTQRGLETRLVPLRGYDLELIPAVPLPRSVTPKLLAVPGRLAGAVHATGKILDRVQRPARLGGAGAGLAEFRGRAAVFAILALDFVDVERSNRCRQRVSRPPAASASAVR